MSPPDAGPPELHALGAAGDGEGPDADAVELERAAHGPVAVGITFEHGHQLAALGSELRKPAGVILERGEVYLDPGPRGVGDAAGLYTLPEPEDCGARGGAPEADGDVVAEAVLHQRAPQPERPRRAAHGDNDGGVEDIDEQGEIAERQAHAPARPS